MINKPNSVLAVRAGRHFTMSIKARWLCGILTSLTLSSSVLAAESAAPLFDDLILTYNSLPDTPAALSIGDADDDTSNSSVIPTWALKMGLSRPEAAALVALAGAYRDIPAPTPPSHARNFTIPEWVAGAAVMLQTQSVLQRSTGANPNFDTAPISLPAHHPPSRPHSEKLIRSLIALESCPGAFASLALKLRREHPDSRFDQIANEARSDDLRLATPPDPNCTKAGF